MLTAEPYKYLEINLAERKDAPGAWTVEAVDEDGGVEQSIFAGPKAYERAVAHKIGYELAAGERC